VCWCGGGGGGFGGEVEGCFCTVVVVSTHTASVHILAPCPKDAITIKQVVFLTGLPTLARRL